MALTFSIDGWSSTNVGLTLRDADARRMVPARSWPTAQVPQKPQRVLMAPNPEYEARELEFVCQLSASNSTNFLADRDELLARMDGNNVVYLTFSDSTGRAFYGRFTEGAHEHVTRANTNWDEVTLTFDLLDPFARDLDLQSVAFSTDTGPALVPLGTAPVYDHTIRIYGPFTNPKIKLRQAGLFHFQPAAGIFPASTNETFSRASDATYRDGSKTLRTASSGFARDHHYVDIATPLKRDVERVGGQVVYQTDFTLSSTGGEWLELDFGAGTITDQAGATQQSARDTGTDFPWELDPRDGAFESSDWLQIEVTSGSAELLYRRAWS